MHSKYLSWDELTSCNQIYINQFATQYRDEIHLCAKKDQKYGRQLVE